MDCGCWRYLFVVEKHPTRPQATAANAATDIRVKIFTISLPIGFIFAVKCSSKYAIDILGLC